MTPVAPMTGDFTMHGARAAMTGGLTHIEEQVTSIERAVVENPGLAFDLAKAVVESACRTILVELKQAYRNLLSGFAPDERAADRARAEDSAGEAS